MPRKRNRPAESALPKWLQTFDSLEADEALWAAICAWQAGDILEVQCDRPPFQIRKLYCNRCVMAPDGSVEVLIGAPTASDSAFIEAPDGEHLLFLGHFTVRQRETIYENFPVFLVRGETLAVFNGSLGMIRKFVPLTENPQISAEINIV